MTTPDPNAPAPTPGTGTPPAPAPSTEPAKTFLQEDVDRIVAERLARARTTPPADYEDLKAKAQELDDLKAAQLSEADRLKAANTAAEARAAAAEEKLAEANKRAAVFAAAQRHGAIDPDAVFALLDPSAVKVGDDGQVTGAEEAVKALLDSKQYLVGTPPTPTPGGADGGPRGKPAETISQESLKTMSPEAIDAAHRAGKLDHILKA